MFNLDKWKNLDRKVFVNQYTPENRGSYCGYLKSQGKSLTVKLVNCTVTISR